MEGTHAIIQDKLFNEDNMNLYNITRGQLIVIWGASICLLFFGGVTTDDRDTETIGVILVIFSLILLFFSLFYTIGWQNYNKKKEKVKGTKKEEVKDKDEELGDDDDEMTEEYNDLNGSKGYSDYNDLEYAGFWIRVWASIIDTFLLLIITMPILLAIYGIDYLDSGYWVTGGLAGLMDFLLSCVLPAFAVILFWMYRQATPGKMAIHAEIVSAQTGERPTTGQCVGRYFSYIPSTLIFGIGIFWVAFDKRKQGWHDKLAGTVVVKKKEYQS